jgi:sulfate permease, SulP family
MTTDTRTAENSTGIRRFIPILSWLPRYDHSWLTVDLIAGLTLWGLAVPERGHHGPGERGARDWHRRVLC